MKQYKILKDGDLDFRQARIYLHDAEVLENEAKLAMNLIERWGLVSGTYDKLSGEDSAGRARLRLLTPEELVQRAFSTAQLAFAEARKRNLTATIPLPGMSDIHSH